MHCLRCNMVLGLCTVFIATSTVVLAKPAESDRVLRKDSKLSDQEHYVGDGHDHNAEYDHDAFLGEEEAKTFESLTPEESRRRLGQIFDRIDKDKDGLVTSDELTVHIENQQKRYIFEDVAGQWRAHNQNADEVLTWDEYNETTYSSLSEEELSQLEENERMDFRKMIRRDKKRWESADLDGDKAMNMEEFTSFLHPEESSHMRSIVIEETLEDIDQNGDGFVDLEEYIGDMFKPESDGEQEPSWVVQEREQFGRFRDRDGDGKMNHAEIGEWILPTEYDHSEAEAKHLMYEADVNKDDKLSRQEVIDKYDLFVGSQATDFGEALTRHDEF